jgi:hypothetical protein
MFVGSKARPLRRADNLIAIFELIVYTSVAQPFFFPYPLIRLFIYEYPLSSLPPPIHQNSFFLISLD